MDGSESEATARLEHNALLLSFLSPRSRRRVGPFLEKGAKSRGKFQKALYVSELDDRFVTKLSGSAGLPGNIVSSLRKAGAPDEVYVFSCDPVLDDRMMPIVDAVELAASSFERTFVSCLPKALMYFREGGIKGDHILE